MKIGRTIGLLPCLLVVSSIALAQEAPRTPAVFECDFNRSFTSIYDQVDFSGESRTEDFKLTFASVDVASGTAQLIGNAGAASVILLQATGGLNSIERTEIGNINRTTVFTRVAEDGRFLSAHSRHVAIDGDPVISQYFGSCAAGW